MSSSQDALMRRCRARLAALDLPVPISIVGVCQLVENQRGRPLTLLPLTSSIGPFGVLVSSANADYVFFAQNTTPVHQRHIAMHELCHLLCGHRSQVVADSDLLKLLVPDAGPKLIETVLGRSAYTAEEEREAEVLASLILEGAGSCTPAGELPSDADGLALLARLRATLQESSGPAD